MHLEKLKQVVNLKVASYFDAKYGEWLGCHMIGAGVTDMIAEAVLEENLRQRDTRFKSIHPHPTMSEAVMEAVADAYDEVIHI